MYTLHCSSLSRAAIQCLFIDFFVDVSQTSEVSPVPRKRRWGSSAKKTAVAISTDSLKVCSFDLLFTIC